MTVLTDSSFDPVKLNVCFGANQVTGSRTAHGRLPPMTMPVSRHSDERLLWSAATDWRRPKAVIRCRKGRRSLNQGNKSRADLPLEAFGVDCAHNSSSPAFSPTSRSADL
jgi:hypothetical protein